MSTLDVTKAWVSSTFTHERQLTCFRFSPDGKRAVAGGQDAKLWSWTLEDGAKTPIPGHASWLAAVAFSADGRLYSADLHANVIAHDRWRIDAGHRPFLRAMALSPDGRTLVTAGDDAVARVWSVETGKLVRELKGHKTYIYAAAFAPDGTIVTGDLSGRIRHWGDSLLRELDASILHSREGEMLASVGGVRSIAFSPDGRSLAVGGLKDAKSNTFCPGTPAIVVFDWKSGERTSLLETKDSKADGYVNALRYLPDGMLCAVSEAHGGNAGLWFWKPGETAPFHSIPAPAAYEIDLHPDGLRLGLCAYEARGQNGNGMRAKTREEYVPNGGSIKLVSLFEKPKKK